MAIAKALLYLLVGGILSRAAAQSAPERPHLFPVPPSLESGHLKVGEIHEIFYTLCGNPQGTPVFVLHGGPGSGCYPRLAQYFDPQKFLIVLHDQRGAGRSRPAGELRENTTQHLVADIEQLREHFGIREQALVFGGSWGSTLALAYAEAHPEHVRGLILRGVFTACADEPLNGYVGPMPRMFFPEVTAEFDAALPGELKPFEPQVALKLFSGSDTAAQRRVAEAWMKCAVKTGKLHVPDEDLKGGLGDFDPAPGARIDCHYGANGFFLKDNQLLRDADKLQDIPITIINGRYDLICPPPAAWRLHQRLPKSKLVFVEEAGHSEAEPGITAALLRAVAEFE
jgi:proline iminopeptidase